MQGHSTSTTDTIQIALGTNQRQIKAAVLTRWVPSERKFVVGEFNWSDPLDVALGIALAAFRPGIDKYDA